MTEKDWVTYRLQNLEASVFKMDAELEKMSQELKQLKQLKEKKKN